MQPRRRGDRGGKSHRLSYSRPAPFPRRAAALSAAGLLVVSLAASGCSPVAESRDAAKKPHAPIPLLHLHRIRGDHADPLRPLHVSVSRGRLRELHVRCSGCKGKTLAGKIVHNGKGWMSRTAPPPGARLRVLGRAVDGVGHLRHLRNLKTKVSGPDTILHPVISPASGTVGIGQPIIVYFNHPVVAKAMVEKHMVVKSSKHVKGAWSWITDSVVHYRPRTFWPAHTHVKVEINIGDRYLRGQWGDGDHGTSFDIGPAQVSTVDVASHEMVVKRDGQVVRTIPVSTGRDKYPTAGGIHIVLSKTPKMIMDSATVGIPRNSPDGYYEKVFWDTRISNSGEFVHAAPWSVADQGVSNVSHGCVNVSPEAARWFYYFSQIGDVVVVTHSVRPPIPGDAGMLDWNTSWQEWKAGSALHNN